MKLDNILQKIISWLFAGMFFWVPLFFTPLNSELFEFNKILLVYAFTALIAGLWIGRMILQKKLIFRKTLLDVPLILFLLSQIFSTLFSIDPHTSIFGYYSRFNGGLLSTVSYLLLYWVFVSNCNISDVKKSLKFSFLSAAIVSIYGILEHFGHSFSCLMFGTGFNVSCWVQKVQERVFATLGQPNWLAAYLAVLIPLSWSFALNLNDKLKIKNKERNFAKFIVHYSLFIILFLCLLFTQSRSGFLAFLLSFGVFWGIIFYFNHSQTKTILKPFIILNSLFIILIIILGSPFSQINKYLHYKSYLKTDSPTITQPLSPITSLDGGISESGDIRKIVWQGAAEIFKHYPVFGSGVETFAYSYYNFRPMEHNLVSEWDFLYNKAHNEYLNYLSTTGILGLGTYLIFIGSFVFWNFKKCTIYNLKCTKKNEERENNFTFYILHFTLFSGWLSLLVTNFFGFSVVVTSLYFFLVPAFIFILSSSVNITQPTIKSYKPTGFLLVPVIFTFYILHFTLSLWRADLFYNQGLKLAKQGQYYESYQSFDKAIQISPNEPVFLSEMSASTASLAQITSQQEPATASAELVKLAVAFSDKAKTVSPKNLNIIKSQIKIFYTLSTLQPEFLQKAIDAAQEAISLSPTDPKLVYNLGLLYGRTGQGLLAIQTIEKAVEMKPNYVDARNALSLFYEDIGDKEKALEQLEILIQLAPENKEDFEKRIEKFQL